MTVLNGQPIVIIDDDKSICRTLKLHFERRGFDVTTAHRAEDGLKALDPVDSAIVILDVRLPDANGVEFLKEIRSKDKNYYSIMITAFPDMESTVKAAQNGVGEYIHKPIDINEIDSAVDKAREFFVTNNGETQSLIEVPKLNSQKDLFIGKSHRMKDLFKQVGMVSLSKSTVLINGESGTGKELVARAIHDNSPNASSPFISVNCSAIVDTLLESELFGHVKGAFTGAIKHKEGWFSLARDGTIFLDEIGEMSINLQAKLLRVLQEREFAMVGGKSKLKADCRVISATNRNLEQMVRTGAFREDLYYRFKVIKIDIPPLYDRKEDIPDLALYFVAKKSQEANRNIKYITNDSINFLMTQNWKGNVRQLENVITHAVIMSHGDCLTKDHFSSVVDQETTSYSTQEEEPREQPSLEPTRSRDANSYRPVSLNEVEKEQIFKTLTYTKWHKGKTCEILGITRPRLNRKISRYSIKPTHFTDN